MPECRRGPIIGGASCPRPPFWEFATRLCGLGQDDSKIDFTTAQRAIWKSVDRRIALTVEEGEAYRALTGKAPWKAGSKVPPFICMTLCRGGGSPTGPIRSAGLGADGNVSGPDHSPAEPGATGAAGVCGGVVCRKKDSCPSSKGPGGRASPGISGADS